MKNPIFHIASRRYIFWNLLFDAFVGNSHLVCFKNFELCTNLYKLFFLYFTTATRQMNNNFNGVRITDAVKYCEKSWVNTND